MNIANASLFQRTSKIAWYDDTAQIIHHGCLDHAKLFSKNKKVKQGYINSILPYCYHEMSHWYDHISTLWGQKNFVLLYNAINAWAKNDPAEFWRIAAHEVNRKKTFNAGYFTVMEHNCETAARLLPWKLKTSTGYQFGADGRLSKLHPILFARSSNASGQSICRMPLSSAALSETIATAAEISLRATLAKESTVRNSREFIAQHFEMEKEYIALCYTANFMRYAAPVHCFSLMTGNSYFVDAYILSAALAKLIFNLPEALFDRLSIPENEDTQSVLFQIRPEDHDSYLRNRDRGYVYLLACKAFPKKKADVPREERAIDDLIDIMLNKMGLPDYKQLHTKAVAEISSAQEGLIPGPYEKRARDMLQIGMEIFLSRSLVEFVKYYEIQMGKIPILPIIAESGGIYTVSNKPAYDVQETCDRLDMSRQYQEFASSFMNVCIPHAI